MSFIFNFSIFLLSIGTTLCETVQVLHNDLSDEASIIAGGLFEDGLLKNQNTSVIDNHISNVFNRLYGEKWLSIVGPSGIESVVSQFNVTANTTLWLSYNSTNMIVFRLANSTTTTAFTNRSFAEIVKLAVAGGITYRNEYSTSTGAQIVPVINKALAYNFGSTDCDRNLTYNRNSNSCYRIIADKISSDLYSALPNVYSVIVDVLNAGSSYLSFSSQCTIHTYEYVYGNILSITIIDSS